MNILVACEESQRVCLSFLERGHNAFSCDIQEPSGGRPDRHILDDALNAIHGGQIVTMDGRKHDIPKWDLLIAHPPCTYLSVAGNRWLDEKKYGEKARIRHELRNEAAIFFMKFVNADCERIAIENPIGYMNTHFRKPDCIVYPYQFGESNNKPICLWLKGLPILHPTKIVERGAVHRFPNGKTNSVDWAGKSAKERSKTFQGIAQAMAEQWG